MDFFGWDIGGVHLKVAALRFTGGGAAEIRTRVEPFEIWRDPGALASRLQRLLEAAGGGTTRDVTAAAHGVTMTAELSDVFASRAEGVRTILSACSRALAGDLHVLDVRGRFVPLQAARERPRDVAATNWMATALLAARAAPDAILLDVGSTTTDVVPIRAGSPDPRGRTDTDRLVSGELVYTGVLRTPPASLVESVPLRGSGCRVSPERFTQMADVYRILGDIREDEYTVPTPDGRGRGREEALARLARLVCAETADIGAAAIEAIAAWLRDRQIDRVACAILQVLGAGSWPRRPIAVVAGAGSFLAEAAARRAGLEAARLEGLFPQIRGGDWGRAAPSAAIALLLAGPFRSGS